MTYEESIQILKAQQDKLFQQVDMGVWMDSTLGYIEDIFGNLSTQASNFRTLRNDYRASIIGSFFHTKQTNFISISSQHLHELIEYIKRKQKLEANKKIEKVQAQPLPPQPSPVKKVNSPTSTVQQHPKEKKHYVIGIALFWTVALAVSGALFYFGFYVGTTKFDNEKNELYNRKLQLESEVQKARDTIKNIPPRLLDSLSRRSR